MDKSPHQSLVKAVTLPQTAREWRKAASEDKIEIVVVKKDAKKGTASAKTQITAETLKYHGEHPVNVRLRNLGGWKSASVVSRAHYLTARILWRFEGTKMRLSDFKTIINLTSQAEAISKDTLEASEDWKKYCNDIASTSRSPPAPGSATPLGQWTNVRFQQLAILREHTDTDDEAAERATAVSSRTRSKTEPTTEEDKKDIPATSPTTAPATAPAASGEVSGSALPSGDSPSSQMHDSLSSLSEVDYMSLSTASYSSGTSSDRSGASLSKSVQDTSDWAAANPDMAAEMMRQSLGEDVVNSAALNFLQTLCMGCPAAQLDWDAYKYPFKVQLGQASIRAITDGCLIPRDNSDVCAILETKPFLLSANADRTLMQMGLEMLAWIANSDAQHRLERRYTMVSQHHNEIYFTVARFDPGYLAYLLDDNEVATNGDDFLTLHCFGPFNIFNYKHVFSIGEILLTLTIQSSMDHRDRQNL